VAGQFRQTFSPTRGVLVLTLDDRLELFAPAVVILGEAMVVKVADFLVHFGKLLLEEDTKKIVLFPKY